MFMTPSWPDQKEKNIYIFLNKNARLFEYLKCSMFIQCLVLEQTLSGPRQSNLVLIAYASGEGSGAVSPEPSPLAHTGSESRGTFRQTARSLAPLNSWACAVKICHDGMLEDTNSLDGAHLVMIVALPVTNNKILPKMRCGSLKLEFAF